MLVLPWTGASVSEADWHWAVGIWEGEGYVGAFIDKNGRLKTNLAIMTTDGDMVREAMACFDLGKLYWHASKNARHKSSWQLIEQRRDVVRQWCDLAGPYMRTERRRQQAEETSRTLAAEAPGRRPKRQLAYGRESLRQPPHCWKGLWEILDSGVDKR